MSVSVNHIYFIVHLVTSSRTDHTPFRPQGMRVQDILHLTLEVWFLTFSRTFLPICYRNILCPRYRTDSNWKRYGWRAKTKASSAHPGLFQASLLWPDELFPSSVNYNASTGPRGQA